MDYSSPGAVKSPFSPRVRPPITGRRPIGLSSAKKNQNKFMQSAELQGGDVIYKTPMTTIETFGTPLPVMVSEALTFASGEVTVRMSSCGWCWAVAGRRVLAWGRDAAHPAKELALPQTDLAHKADLVVLFYEDGQMPACVGVSPEGVVRYWPSVGQEGAYTDVTCELAGQECERLILKPNGGLLLATTTCTLVRIDTCKEGRPSVTCQTLRPPSGWLGGIGRRVSLLFFGSMPAHGDTKLVGVVVLPGTVPVESEDEDDGECVALVATGPLLQLWRGAELHEHHLRRPLSEAFARAHLVQGDLNSLEILALDVHANGPNGLLLLVAAVNIARSPEMRYALAHVSVEQAERPRVAALVAVRAPREDAALRFLPLHARAALYTASYVAIVCASAASDKAEYIDVSAEGDRIVGAALCEGRALLFSRKHGVLLLTVNEPSAHAPSLCDSPMGSPCPSEMYDGNLSLYEIDPHEVSAITTDLCGKLKTAFLFHVRRSPNAASILAEAFPVRPERDVDAPLDRAVLAVAAEMLDDVPAGDPRWKVGGGAATRVALGSSTALQVSAQLRDKQRAFSLFLDFLRAHMLWRRLGLVSRESGEGCAGTQHALGALAERLAGARALQRAHRANAHLVDAALHQVATGMGPDGEDEEEPEIVEALSSGALSPADVCFRRVSRIGRVLRAVATLPVPAGDPRAAAAHAAQALSLLNDVVAEMHKCRAQWAQWAQPAPSPPPPELGPRALLPALVHLHKRAVPCAAQCSHKSPDVSLRAQVLEAAATLADLILTEAAPLQHSPHTVHIYERMRRDIIQPYIDEGQMERAAVLAEKFKDFELLIEMCVNKNDMDRLYSYIDKYSNEGVAEQAFAWLASRGGPSCALLLRSLGARQAARLEAWLGAAPGRRALLALHRLAAGGAGGAGGVAPAARLLLDLAAEEAHSVARMTTMASLAKLCLLASDEPEVEGSDTWRQIESRLALADMHKSLPRDLRTRHGLLAEDMRVLDPEELLHMYIESESKALNEYDFKKALDLTDFIQDMERRDDLRLRVWCACIRRDDWSQCRVDSPATELQDKMFFRLMDLVHVMGGDLELLLPPVDDILTARELADLVSDPRFHFIIKYGYECMDAHGHQVDA